MRKHLFRLYWWLERRIHPALRYSQIHYRDLLYLRIFKDCEWLDLGCGHQMFGSWMTKEEEELSARSARLVGIDRDFKALKENRGIHHAVFGDVSALPFASGSFDVVTANMVVEHLDRPTKVLESVRRVLRPGGLFIFHTPNRNSMPATIARMMPQALKNLLALVLEERAEKDVFPTHYEMNTEAAICAYASSAGFRVREIRSVSTTAVSALLFPLCVFELGYLRMLEAPSLAGLRTNLIAVLERDE